MLQMLFDREKCRSSAVVHGQRQRLRCESGRFGETRPNVFVRPETFKALSDKLHRAVVLREPCTIRSSSHGVRMKSMLKLTFSRRQNDFFKDSHANNNSGTAKCYGKVDVPRCACRYSRTAYSGKGGADLLRKRTDLMSERSALPCILSPRRWRLASLPTFDKKAVHGRRAGWIACFMEIGFGTSIYAEWDKWNRGEA